MVAVDQVTAAGFEFLSYTLPHHAAWDAARYATALSSCMLALFYLRVAFGSERPESIEAMKTIRIGIISYLSMLLPVALTELQQIGKPVIPWRLPLVLLANIFGWWYIRRRL